MYVVDSTLLGYSTVSMGNWFLRFQDNIASKLQEPITQWYGVTSWKNGISSYTTAKTRCIWHSVYVHCQKLH